MRETLFHQYHITGNTTAEKDFFLNKIFRLVADERAAETVLATILLSLSVTCDFTLIDYLHRTAILNALLLSRLDS